MQIRNLVIAASQPSWSLIGFVCGLSIILLSPLTGCGPMDSPNASNKPAQNESSSDDGHDHDGHDHDGHDHDDHGHKHDGHEHASESLPESVNELAETFAKISKGFAEDDAESVHDQLHDVGHLLEAIESKVKAGEGITDGKQEMAEQSIAALFENFMILDDSLHGDDDADTAAAISKISGELQQLKDVMQ